MLVLSAAPALAGEPPRSDHAHAQAERPADLQVGKADQEAAAARLAAWKARMVRPCAKSGNRLVC